MYFEYNNSIYRVDESFHELVVAVTDSVPGGIPSFCVARVGGVNPISAIVGKQTLASVVGKKLEMRATVGEETDGMQSITIDEIGRAWMSGSKGLWVCEGGEPKKVQKGFRASWLAVYGDWLLACRDEKLQVYKIAELLATPQASPKSTLTADQFQNAGDVLPKELYPVATVVSDDKKITIGWADHKQPQDKPFRSRVTECAFANILKPPSRGIDCDYFSPELRGQLGGVTRNSAGEIIVALNACAPGIYLRNLITGDEIRFQEISGAAVKWVQRFPQ